MLLAVKLRPIDLITTADADAVLSTAIEDALEPHGVRITSRDSGFTTLLTDASRFRFEFGALRATRRTLCPGL